MRGEVSLCVSGFYVFVYYVAPLVDFEISIALEREDPAPNTNPKEIPGEACVCFPIIRRRRSAKERKEDARKRKQGEEGDGHVHYPTGATGGQKIRPQ